MLDPKAFCADDAELHFTFQADDVEFRGVHTGAVTLSACYDANRRILINLGAALPAGLIPDLDSTAEIKFKNSPSAASVLLTKYVDCGPESSPIVEGRLAREPVVIDYLRTASRFEAVLLSSPKTYGKSLILVDRRNAKFCLCPVDKSNGGTCLLVSEAEVSASDPLGPLQELLLFLTFVKGTHCGLGNMKAYDVNGGTAFELHGFTRNDAAKSYTNWFDIEVLSELPGIFLLFSKAMEDQRKAQAIKQTLDFYRASNASREASTEVSIIAAHTGLEALVNYILTAEAGWSEKLVENRSIAFPDKLRASAAFFGLSGAEFEQLPELKPLAKNRSFDAFELVSFFRNRVVHQDQKFTPSGIQLHEAWLLEQWVLEVLILAVIGYRGKIIDRRAYKGWRGTVVQVPSRR